MPFRQSIRITATSGSPAYVVGLPTELVGNQRLNRAGTAIRYIGRVSKTLTWRPCFSSGHRAASLTAASSDSAWIML